MSESSGQVHPAISSGIICLLLGIAATIGYSKYMGWYDTPIVQRGPPMGAMGGPPGSGKGGKGGPKGGKGVAPAGADKGGKGEKGAADNNGKDDKAKGDAPDAGNKSSS